MDSIRGAIVALLASFPVALLLAYLFRLPVPMVGMLGPLGEYSPYAMTLAEVLMATGVAWLFFGVFGGFLLLPLLGAITGHLAGQKYSGAKDKQKWLVLWSSVAGAIPVFGISVLDLFIGPW